MITAAIIGLGKIGRIRHETIIKNPDITLVGYFDPHVKDDTLLTPSDDLGILSGVMRDTIIQIAHDMNINVIEKHINYRDINTMKEAFISSTGIGLLPCYWNDWESNYSTTKLIKKELFKRIKNS